MPPTRTRQAKAPTKRACTAGDPQVSERTGAKFLIIVGDSTGLFTGRPQDFHRPDCGATARRTLTAAATARTLEAPCSAGARVASRSSPPCWPSAPAAGPRLRPRRRRRRAARRLRSSRGPAAGAAQAAQAPPTTVAPPAPLFRVILNDGTALVSYGEFTRVGDRVVFSMPLDSPRGERLQLVNLPASAVNWESTDQYTDGHPLRAVRGDARRGRLRGAHGPGRERAERDRARQGPRAAAPDRRADAAAPRRLAGRALGYRSADVNDMLSLLDEHDLGPARRRAHTPVRRSTWWPRSSRRRCRCCRTRRRRRRSTRCCWRPGCPTCRSSGSRCCDRRSARSTRRAAQLPKQLGAPDARVRPGDARRRTGHRAAIRGPVARHGGAGERRRRGGRRARRREGDVDAAGPRPLARREAEGPGRRPAGPAAGEAGFGPAPPTASRPVGAQGRGVSRVPGPVRSPIDRLAKLRPRLEDVKALAGPAIVVSARPACRTSSASAVSSRSSSPRPTWSRRTRRCSRPPSSGSRRCARASAPRCRATWRRPGTPRPRRPARS